MISGNYFTRTGKLSTMRIGRLGCEKKLCLFDLDYFFGVINQQTVK